MNKTTLCHNWKRALDGWAIPEEILSRASSSPWKLSPERFGPSDSRATTPTVSKIKELLDGQVDPALRSVMDVGCGAGGVSLLILDHASSITGVDVSQEMLEAFKSRFELIGKRGVALKLVSGSWPEVAGRAGIAGVVVCANVLYNVRNPCEFIAKLNEVALVGVVIEVHERHPHSVANAAWKHFWNLDRPSEPTGEQLVEIITSLGISSRSSTFLREPAEAVPLVDDELVESIRQRICFDASRDAEIRDYLMENPVEQLRSRLIWWTK
ncbi:MAG: class I SAM-dependent methyltransferase [Actinomycetota bacterium]|nr:class I SAM-dependent methyltransferase [Actinomycetota bacterium]